MKLFERIERKLLQIRCRYIYLHKNKTSIKGRGLDKAIITIFHDYERHYHDDSISEFSDRGVRGILQIEKRYSVNATYNIVAKLIEDVQPIIKEIMADKHEIASHSFSHSIISKMTKEEIKRDIASTRTLFEKNGLRLNGLRCPQSRWRFKQLPIMLQHGMKWSAESDKADYPYTIYNNATSAIMRMPVIMDDWAYEEFGISPGEMHEKLIACANRIAEKKSYGAIGFHPWVQGKDSERIKAFDDFMNFLSKHSKISLMSFSNAYNLFSE